MKEKEKVVKRDIFAELMQGAAEMKAHREGKLTLRTHLFPVAEVKEVPGPEFFVAARQKFNVSRAVWANMLRLSPRTVEKWEQGGQVSPLAATFVDMVSHYPDTVDRLRTLPKRIARPGGALIYRSHQILPNRGDKVLGQLSTDQLRGQYRPKKVRVLFVGEAPPAGGTFFYAGNSQVYRHLEESLREHLKGERDFLKAFRDRGYFLDDLMHSPVDETPVKDRKPLLKKNIPLLAKRLAQYQPEIVVTILKRIAEYVEDALSLAALDVPHYSVPFPGNGQQKNFKQEMQKIVQLLP